MKTNWVEVEPTEEQRRFVDRFNNLYFFKNPPVRGRETLEEARKSLLGHAEQWTTESIK